MGVEEEEARRKELDAIDAAQVEANMPGVDHKMLAELREMTLKEVKQRARSVGISNDTIDDMEDEDDPKEAIIQIYLQQAVTSDAEEEAAEAEAERAALE